MLKIKNYQKAAFLFCYNTNQYRSNEKKDLTKLIRWAPYKYRTVNLKWNKSDNSAFS